MLRNTGGIKKGEMTADELKHTGGLSEDTGKGCVNERETIYANHLDAQTALVAAAAIAVTLFTADG